MKFSLITTVRNESEDIERFLDSIAKQSLLPVDIVINDNNSTDDTVKKIREYARRNKKIGGRIRVIIAGRRKATIGAGRNRAMSVARGDIIVVSDPGNVLDRDWIRRITRPFPKADAVFGVYKALYDNTPFQKYQAIAAVAAPDEIFSRMSRLSHRNVAIKKSMWEKVGRYKDNLERGEDTDFNQKLIEAGAKILPAKNAVVYWGMRDNWRSFAMPYYRDGESDMKSRVLFRMKANVALVGGFWGWPILSVAAAISAQNVFWPILSLPFIVAFVESAAAWRRRARSFSMTGFAYVYAFFLVKRIFYALGAARGLL